MKINYKEEHDKLSRMMNACKEDCIEIQNECSKWHSDLRSIKINCIDTIPPGAEIEIDQTIIHLIKADWLLDYVREELERAQQCFVMRNENGEIE